MQKSLGIAALVIAIVSIFIPVYGTYLTIVAGALAAFSYSEGFALGLSSIIINIVNIYFMTPSLDLLTAVSGPGVSMRTFFLVAQLIALAVLIVLNKKRKSSPFSLIKSSLQTETAASGQSSLKPPQHWKIPEGRAELLLFFFQFPIRLTALVFLFAGLIWFGYKMLESKKINEMESEKNNNYQSIYNQSQIKARTFQSLNAKITSLRFFEGGANMPPYGERKYETKFLKSDVSSIYWELDLSHPQPSKRVDYSIAAVCYWPDNTILGRSTNNAFVEANWTYSYYSNACSHNTLGQWSTGVYKVDINIEGQRVATGTFEILPPESPKIPHQEVKVQTKDQQTLQAPIVPIHKQGDTYTLESISLDSGTRNTTERKVILATSEKLVIESRNSQSKSGKVRKLEFTPEWNLITVRNSDGSGLNYSPPLKYYEFPLTSGKTWQQTSIETNIKSGVIKEHTLSAVVGDWENVTVPAGTFRGVKVTIQAELVDRATGQKTISTDTSWYVPEVRRGVRSLTSINSPEGVESRQDLQLIRYDLIK